MSAEQHRRMATRKRLWHSYLPLVMWDIGTRINLKKMSEWYDWFSCRSNTNACEKCPVSTTDLRIFTMASWSACPVVPKQISGLGRNQGETYTLITFLLPYTLNGWIFMNQKEPGEVQNFYRFTVRILLHISRWWSTIALRIYDYLQMQRRVPIIAGTYGSWPSSSDHLWRAGVPSKQPIPEESPAPAQSVLTKFNFYAALTSINAGLRRMTSSWFRGSRTTSGRS